MSLDGYSFLVLSDEGRSEAAIRGALPPSASVRVVAIRDAIGFTAQLVADAAPDMILVACSTQPDAALRAIAEINATGRGVSLIAVCDGSPNGFMGPAFDAGVDDLIVLPLAPDQFAFELQKVLARRRAPGQEAAKSPMITVLGPKGGTGKTMTSCNLAVALAAGGARPVVVDIDLQFGDVGLALGLKPDRTIFDLVTSGGTLDAEKVDTFVMKHPSGAAALLAPTRPDQAAAITTTFLRDVFDILRTTYDYVIVDTPPAFSPEVIVAIDASSDLCMVGMLDALSLKDTKIGFETLEQMGYRPDEVMLVLNRADSSVGISMSDVYALLRKNPEILVPSDRAIPRALTNGSTIFEADPGSGAGRAFGSLARKYSAEQRVEPSGSGDQRVGRRLRLSRKGN